VKRSGSPPPCQLRLFATTSYRGTTSGGSGSTATFLEAYRMFAYDRGWVRRMHEAIRNGLSAEAAVEKVQSDMRSVLHRELDPYLRDRLHDLDDITNRLLRVALNKPHGIAEGELPKDAIIVARTNGAAADLLDTAGSASGGW